MMIQYLFFFLDEKEASALGGQDCIQILTLFRFPKAKMNKLAPLKSTYSGNIHFLTLFRNRNS
jgi:hypothetical protein